MLLTYVTEAPAWKPSYRVVVGTGGKVMLEGWAIVDNTTTEDWKRVLVGVGASSALAFRYDLWSVRAIDRDLLAGEARFAIAPPTGVSPHAEASAEELVSLEANEVRGDARAEPGDAVAFSGGTTAEATYVVDGVHISDAAPVIDPTSTTTGVTLDRQVVRNLPGRSFSASLRSSAGGQADAPAAPPPPPPIQQGDAKLAAIVDKVRKTRRDVVIEVHGAPGTEAQARARGTAVKNKLVDDGVPAARIHIVPKIGAGERDPRARARGGAGRRAGRRHVHAPATSARDTPVGESHFMAERPMTVRAGSSAMVAMVHGETTGGVVYLYDPISERGDERFAFKAVRLDNPTVATLEPGPVTVYGEGRFIGEGITEPVPPRASVVVPFALDKQVVVDAHQLRAATRSRSSSPCSAACSPPRSSTAGRHATR